MILLIIPPDMEVAKKAAVHQLPTSTQNERKLIKEMYEGVCWVMTKIQ